MYSNLIRSVGWLAVLAIGILSLLPGDLRPHLGPNVPNQLEHFLAYFAAACALALGYSDRKQILKTALLLMLYAALLETAQTWIPGRTSQVIDFVSSSFGVWIGIGLTLLTRRPWPIRQSGGHGREWNQATESNDRRLRPAASVTLRQSTGAPSSVTSTAGDGRTAWPRVFARRGRGSVKKALLAATVGALLISSSPLFAQGPLRPLTPGERKIYHACLRSAWMEHYCRWRAFGYISDYGLAVHTCLASNHIRSVPVPGYGIATRDACWYLAQSRAH